MRTAFQKNRCQYNKWCFLEPYHFMSDMNELSLQFRTLNIATLPLTLPT